MPDGRPQDGLDIPGGKEDAQGPHRGAPVHAVPQNPPVPVRESAGVRQRVRRRAPRRQARGHRPPQARHRDLQRPAGRRPAGLPAGGPAVQPHLLPPRTLAGGMRPAMAPARWAFRAAPAARPDDAAPGRVHGRRVLPGGSRGDGVSRAARAAGRDGGDRPAHPHPRQRLHTRRRDGAGRAPPVRRAPHPPRDPDGRPSVAPITDATRSRTCSSRVFSRSPHTFSTGGSPTPSCSAR